MELELSLKRWNRLIGQLSEYTKILRHSEAELEEICSRIRKEEKTQENISIVKSIQKQEDSLHGQVIRLNEMRTALEKIKRLYEECEDSIVETGEGEYRHFPEEFQVAKLRGWDVVSVILK